MDKYSAVESRDLPRPPSWKKAIGVGIVVMGLAIGTGELILWPHLVTKYGIHLLWLALIGIVAQYFINQEVARNAVATGESFFTASSRCLSWLTFFWLFSGVIMYIWPGWASAIGTILKELTGFGSYRGWALFAIGLILVLTFSGKVAYTMLEKSLKIVVPSFFLLLVTISFFNLSPAYFGELFQSLSHFSIPKDIDINTLLSAIVFAGAGGMLNLCVSLWYRDKQIGMGAYVGRVTNPITGKQEAVETKTFSFPMTQENLKRWKGWMRFVRIDQGIIFTLIGFITLVLLSLNAHAVLAPKGLVPEGTEIAILQASIFGEQWGVFGSRLFLVMSFLMLFSVMWTVTDALTRIICDIIYTNAHSGPYQRLLKRCANCSIGKMYYTTIIVICLVSGSLIFLKQQPLTLLVTSAVLGGLTMAIYTPLLIYINNTKLPKPIRPSWFTNVMMTFISIFFIYFAYRVIAQYF